MSQPRAPARAASPTTRRDRFPRRRPTPSPARQAASRTGARRRRRRDDPTRAPPPSPPRSRAILARGHGPRQEDRRAAPGHARRHRDPLPLARQPPRVRARARSARHPDLRLQGTRLLRRRRDQGRRRADSLPRRARRPTCARPRSCGRASSACRIAAWRCWRPPWLGADRRRRRAGRRRRRSTTRIGACWRWRARRVPRWLAQVDRIPPAELIEQILRRHRLRLRAARAAAARRRGRT